MLLLQLRHSVEMTQRFFKPDEDSQLDLTIHTSTCCPGCSVCRSHPKCSSDTLLVYLADPGERPVTGHGQISWTPAGVSLHFSAPLDTRPLPFLCDNLTSEKIPVHLSTLFLSKVAQHGPVLCCGAAALHQCIEPGRRSCLAPQPRSIQRAQGAAPMTGVTSP